MVSRRTLLAGSTTLGTLPIAGCGTSIFSDGGCKLECLSVLNSHTEPHTVDVRVEYDGEEVYSGSIQIEAAEEPGPVYQEWVESTWPDEPDHFHFQARLKDETEWETYDCGNEDSSTSVHVEYYIDQDGSGFFHATGTDIGEPVQTCPESNDDESS